MKRFIPSEFSSNATRSENMVPTPVGSGKIEIVDYLRAKENLGVTWSALVTGAFFDLWVLVPLKGLLLLQSRREASN